MRRARLWWWVAPPCSPAARRGDEAAMTAKVRFEDVKVGDEIPTLSKVVKREEVKAYADASGDQNPLHQDDNFARSVGFPGIIAHGMFTMAHLTKALTDWVGDPGALKRMKVQFRAVVFMDEEIV